MIRFDVEMEESFTANIRKQDLTIAFPENLPPQSRRKIFEYGLQRILNDSSASAKTPAEALELARKRWDSLVSGQIRQTRVVGSADPVKREAMKIALAKVQANAGFKAWLATNSLKVTDKEATEKLRELAKPLAEREDIVALAKANVDAAAEIEIELDL